MQAFRPVLGSPFPSPAWAFPSGPPGEKQKCPGILGLFPRRARRRTAWGSRAWPGEAFPSSCKRLAASCIFQSMGRKSPRFPGRSNLSPLRRVMFRSPPLRPWGRALASSPRSPEKPPMDRGVFLPQERVLQCLYRPAAAYRKNGFWCNLEKMELFCNLSGIILVLCAYRPRMAPSPWSPPLSK